MYANMILIIEKIVNIIYIEIFIFYDNWMVIMNWDSIWYYLIFIFIFRILVYLYYYIYDVIDITGSLNVFEYYVNIYYQLLTYVN